MLEYLQQGLMAWQRSLPLEKLPKQHLRHLLLKSKPQLMLEQSEWMLELLMQRIDQVSFTGLPLIMIMNLILLRKELK